VHATLVETTMKLSDLMRIEAGDIIPIELPEYVTLCAEGVPLFRCRVGVSNGVNAVQILEAVKREAWRDPYASAETAAGKLDGVASEPAVGEKTAAKAHAADARRSAQSVNGSAAAVRSAPNVSTSLAADKSAARVGN